MHEVELKIYFAGSIRGGRDLKDTYSRMIQMLQSFGRVFTEHVGKTGNIIQNDKGLSDREIHDRDMEWLIRSDLLVAEVSVPSLGVGYEIGRAIHLKKPVLCLYHKDSSHRLSAMISGSNDLQSHEYSDLAGVRLVVEKFIKRNIT